MLPCSSHWETNTYLNELIVGIGLDLLQILQRGAVIETIHVDDIVLGVLLDEVNDHVGGTRCEDRVERRHKTSSSSDEDVVGSVVGHFRKLLVNTYPNCWNCVSLA